MANSFRRRSDGGYTTLQTEQPFKVPDNKILQSATFTPQLSTVEYTPGSSENYPSEYNGVHKVIVNGIQNSEPNLIPENIVSGVTIFGVEGEADAARLESNKQVTITASDTLPKLITPDPNLYDGMADCTVSLDNNLSDKILYGTNLLGVSGSCKIKNNENVITNSSISLEITPTSSGEDTYSAMNKATVSLDPDLSSSILSGTSILGVSGSYTVGPRYVADITSDRLGITIYPNNANAMSYCYVRLDDSMAQYIKSGVYILGVMGTYTGGDTPTPTPTTYQVYDNGSWKNGYYYGFNVPSGVYENESGSYFAFSTTNASSGTYYVYTTYKVSVPSGYTKLSVNAYFSSTTTQESCSFGFSSSSSVSSASYSINFSNGSNSTRTVSVSGISSGYISFKISDRLHSSTSISVHSIYFEK